MEPISSTVAAERAKPFVTDVPEAAAIVSTIERRRGDGSPYYSTSILAGEYDGTLWETVTAYAAMLVHQLVVAALKSGRPLPEGGERG